MLECWFDPEIASQFGFNQMFTPGLGPLRDVTASPYCICGINLDNTITCVPGVADLCPSIPNTGSYIKISTGPYGVCAINTNENIECWINDLGVSYSPPPSQDILFEEVYVGLYFACGLTKGDRFALCWGASYPIIPGNISIADIEIASPYYVNYFWPTPLGDDEALRRVYSRTAIRYSDNTVELTDNVETISSPFCTCQWSNIVGSQDSICGICSNDNSTYCWGNSIGIVPNDTFQSIASGPETTCGLSNNIPKCWGKTEIESPMDSFSSLAVSSSYVCGIRLNDSIAECWGDTQDWQDPPQEAIVSIDAGQFFMCGLYGNGSIVCWSHSNYTGTLSYPLDSGYTQITVNTYHACALHYNTTIVCWGEDFNGSLSAPLGVKFEYVEAGYQYTCASTRYYREILCWGMNAPNINEGMLVICRQSSPEYCVQYRDHQLKCSENLVPNKCSCNIFFNLKKLIVCRYLHFSIFCVSSNSQCITSPMSFTYSSRMNFLRNF